MRAYSLKAQHSTGRMHHPTDIPGWGREISIFDEQQVVLTDGSDFGAHSDLINPENTSARQTVPAFIKLMRHS